MYTVIGPIYALRSPVFAVVIVAFVVVMMRCHGSFAVRLVFTFFFSSV